MTDVLLIKETSILKITEMGFGLRIKYSWGLFFAEFCCREGIYCSCLKERYNFDCSILSVIILIIKIVSPTTSPLLCYDKPFAVRYRRVLRKIFKYFHYCGKTFRKNEDLVEMISQSNTCSNSIQGPVSDFLYLTVHHLIHVKKEEAFPESKMETPESWKICGKFTVKTLNILSNLCK